MSEKNDYLAYKNYINDATADYMAYVTEHKSFGSDDTEEDSGFKKFDTGKPRITLFPPKVLAEILEAFEYGAKKYGDFNWKECQDPMRFYDAAFRHMEAVRAGEGVDEESGNFHLIHAIISLIILHELTRPEE